MPLFQDISTPDFDRIREVLHRLAANPPQVLLLEGGTEPQRLAAARDWAACVNCQQPGGEGGPCLICPTCMQIDAGEHLDVLAYDGRISNADDEAHPGPIRALNMDNIRELKQKLRGTLPTARAAAWCCSWAWNRTAAMRPMPCSRRWKNPRPPPASSCWPPSANSSCPRWSRAPSA